MRHFVMGPSSFRFGYVDRYAEAARTWLHDQATIVDTTHPTAAQAASEIAEACK